MLPSRGLVVLCACLLPRQISALAIGTASVRRCAVAAPRSSEIAALEAFDLLPVVDCLKLDSMDVVQMCMDKLEPWMELTEGGDLTFSLNAVNGFIGGTVGVIGTVLAAQIKKGEVKERLKCVYCDGSGEIMCGHCLGTGMVSYMDAEGTLRLGEPCENCEGTGTVVCINCQGSGLSVPEDFLQILGDQEVGFTEQDYIGLFDETPIPGRAPPVVPTPVPATKEKATASAGASTATKDEPSKPGDYTGGLG